MENIITEIAGNAASLGVFLLLMWTRINKLETKMDKYIDKIEKRCEKHDERASEHSTEINLIKGRLDVRN